MSVKPASPGSEHLGLGALLDGNGGANGNTAGDGIAGLSPTQALLAACKAGTRQPTAMKQQQRATLQSSSRGRVDQTMGVTRSVPNLIGSASQPSLPRSQSNGLTLPQMALRRGGEQIKDRSSRDVPTSPVNFESEKLRLPRPNSAGNLGNASQSEVSDDDEPTSPLVLSRTGPAPAVHMPKASRHLREILAATQNEVGRLERTASSPQVGSSGSRAPITEMSLVKRHGSSRRECDSEVNTPHSGVDTTTSASSSNVTFFMDRTLGREPAAGLEGDRHQILCSNLLGRRKMEIARISCTTSSSSSHPGLQLRSPKSRRKLELAQQQPLTPVREIRWMKEGHKIYDLYVWEEVLQEEGSGGKVVVCRPKVASENMSTDVEYVLKIKSKEDLISNCCEETFRKAQERLLNVPPHHGVVPIREVLEDDQFYYIVMEKASEGPLFISLLSEFQDGVIPAGEVRKAVQQILEGVAHVHQQSIVHRDIKPDNMVVTMVPDPQSPTGSSKKVALIDFDHADTEVAPISPKSAKSPGTREDSSFFGTMRFNAPESFQTGCYSAQSDLYGVGVTLYLLMVGSMPYDDRIFGDDPTRLPKRACQREAFMRGVYQRMLESPINWECSPWPEQPLCREFCQKLLAFDPLGRFASAEEALQHKWITSGL